MTFMSTLLYAKNTVISEFRAQKLAVFLKIQQSTNFQNNILTYVKLEKQPTL